MVEVRVLDSFALLAFLGGEPGGEKVARLMEQAERDELLLLMTWVNLGEVAYIVVRRWGQECLCQVLAMLDATALVIVPVERELALAAAHIKAEHPLAYADAFAAALAMQTGSTLITGDPEFRLLEDVLDVQWMV